MSWRRSLANLFSMKSLCGALGVWLLLAEAGSAAGLSPEQIARLPAPSGARVDFSRDVKPLLDTACVKCHGKGKDKGGFSIETRTSFP